MELFAVRGQLGRPKNLRGILQPPQDSQMRTIGNPMLGRVISSMELFQIRIRLVPWERWQKIPVGMPKGSRQMRGFVHGTHAPQSRKGLRIILRQGFHPRDKIPQQLSSNIRGRLRIVLEPKQGRPGPQSRKGSGTGGAGIGMQIQRRRNSVLGTPSQQLRNGGPRNRGPQDRSVLLVIGTLVGLVAALSVPAATWAERLAEGIPELQGWLLKQAETVYQA